MKTLVLALAVISLTVFSCKKESVDSKDEQEVTTASADATTYTLDTVASVIKWNGYKINESTKEEGSHFGTIHFSEGNFAVKDSVLEGGSFTANMNTMTATDIGADEGLEKLNTHLKEDDFLGVEEFPTAKFEITKVTALNEGDFNSEVEGNLTIRDITKNYTFKANVAKTDSTYTLNSDDLNIDRQEYNIKFSHAGDNIVKDVMKLQISLSGKK